MAVAIWSGRLRSTSLLLAVLLMIVTLTESSVIVIGGTEGWRTGFDYDAWATSQNIQPRVGDSLVFVNPDPSSHTVGFLDSADSYLRCILGGATGVVPTLSGKNYTFVIPATLEGTTFYAVCTIPGHCTDNQKIKGTVLAALDATIPPPSAPPSGGPETSGSPYSSDPDMNRLICWTTAILLIAACFWNSG